MTTTVTLHEGDNRDHLRRLIDQGVRVHAVVTDPPYGLTSVTKRFGGEKAAPAKFGTDGAFSRVSAGFMGSKWDGTGIERDPEFWRLIHDILLPGGYVLAFSSPRTGHWQACAMETAGFVMHPFLAWLYGSGMPKAHNAAMAIDKALGVKGARGAPKTAAHAGWIERGRMRDDEGHEGWQRPWMDDADKVSDAARVYVPGSAEAQRWDGWAYGAQALKPALEPIYVGQRPFEGKTGPANFLKHGVGAINIAACRVEPTGESRSRLDEPSQCRDYSDGGNTDFTSTPGPRGGHPEGRHPANLLHDGSDDVISLFPNGTAGSAARFFCGFPTATESAYEGGTQQEHTMSCEPIFYHGKAGKADRAGSKHPTVKPIPLMQWLCRLVTPAGGTVLDPFAGSGTTGEAAQREGFSAILMEGETSFAADIRNRFGLPIVQATRSTGFDDILGGDLWSPVNDLSGKRDSLDLAALLG